MISCESLIRKGPVIALTYDNNLLYFGNHNYLEIRDIKNETKTSFKVFNSFRITSIKIILKENKNLKLSVVGEYSLAIINVEDEFKISIDHIFHYHDWILQTCSISNTIMIIITSRSDVILYNFISNELINQKVLDTDRKILYSCDIIYTNSQNSATVATGNAFGVISIFKIETDNRFINVSLIDYYEIHSGPVFSICISSKIDFIASSADDRCICLWSINQKNKLFKEYGHFARIWQVIFTHNNKSLISVSEDGTCIHWSLCGEVIKSYTCLSKRESIWRVCLGEINSIIISCQSGSIIAWNYQPFTISPTYFTIDDEKIQSLDMTLDGKIYFITVSGKLYHKKSNEENYEMLICDEKFKNYAYICLHDETPLLFIGNLSGDIRIFDSSLNMNQEILTKSHNGKIVYARFIKNYSKNIYNIITADYYGILQNHEIYYDEFDLRLNKKIAIESNNHTSTVSTLDSTIEINMFICTVGYEDGSVLIYGGSYENPVVLKELNFLHNKKCCTCIKIDNKNLYTCGKDGIINIFIKSKNSYKFQKSIQCNNLPWLAEIYLTKYKRLLVMGFYKQSKFCIFDPQDQTFLTKIKCGGGYRQWRCQIQNYNDHIGFQYKITFLERPYIKYYEEIINFYNNYHIIEPCWHSKEIRCQEIIGHNDNKSIFLMSFAGEEASIYISLYDILANKLKKIVIINDHPSSIFGMKSCDISTTGSYKKFILISVGARSSIFLYKIKFCNKFTKFSDFIDLFCFKRLKSISSSFGSNKKDIDCLDLRATCIEIIKCSYTIYLIIGFSDGVIRFYSLTLNEFFISYNKSTPRQNGIPTSIIYSSINKNITATYSNGNILTFYFDPSDISIRSQTKQANELNFFEITLNDIFYETSYEYKNFNTSIFSLCEISNTNNSKYKEIINKIAVGFYNGSVFILETQNNLFHEHSFSHSGPISAICSIDENLITVSTDKKLKIWSVADMKLLYERFISIYDPCTISCYKFHEKHILIVSGIGTEIFLLENDFI